jgi:hypothetical protein
LASPHHVARSGEAAGDDPGGRATVVKLYQRSEEQQHLRENGDACQRATNRSCQLDPLTGTHEQ